MNNLLCFVLILTFLTVDAIDSECWKCSCNLRSNCKPMACVWDLKQCGSLKFTEEYWDTCGNPGSSFKACKAHYPCVYECFKLYKNNPTSHSGCSAECKPHIKDHSSSIPADDPYLKYVESLSK
uniref:Uncharacterized protein n=1 Tax=Magallana gigas TaxID=29159 RepID=A0A8W8NRV3_MAGGI